MNKTTKNRHARGFTLVELLVVIAIIAALAGLATPVILKARKSADLTQATNNLRNLAVFLGEFENEYGTFPSETIYTENSNRFRNASGGQSANDLLGLLIAGNFTDSEEIFYAKGGARSSKQPDNVINTASKILQDGECGFGYVMLSGGVAMSTSDNGSRPLVVAPLEPNSGGSNPKFNSGPYNGRAVYLRIDSAVKQNTIDQETSKVFLSGNLTLFETGRDTAWGTDDTPDVRPPR